MSIDIPLEAARAIIGAARDHADRIGVKVSIAVVDAGGNLKAFERMDGAEIAGPTLAVDKAYTAVANSAATHELAKQASPSGPLFGLHANAGGRYVIFGGGIPLLRENEIIGAIGVSGGTVEDDVACAEFGILAAKELLK
jgi:uncharacterized protein GlcG (DUF336 family)